MLTVNADDHPLMKRFHKPDAEKRSVVIVRPDAYQDWLSCRNTDEARSFLHLYPADEMHAETFPLSPRKARAMPSRTMGSSHCWIEHLESTGTACTFMTSDQ